MKVLLLVAGAALTLTACGGGDKGKTNTTNAANAANASNTMTTGGNMAGGENMMVNQLGTVNGTMGANNMAPNSATQNLMMKDKNTNDPDTNLANGL